MPTVRVVFFSFLLLVAACDTEAQDVEQGPQALPVRVMTPVVREVTLWDEYIGRFNAVQRVELRPRVSGYLEEVHFDDGATVEAGDLLFTIDARPFQASLDRAEAAAAGVRTSGSLAQSELERARTLLDQRAGSQEEYDRAEQALAAARAEGQGAEAAVREAALAVSFTEIHAPIAGRIDRRLVDPGNLVTEAQTVLTTIVSVDPIHFAFEGTEADYLNYVRLSRQGERPSSRDAPNPVRIKIEGAEGYDVEGRMDFVGNEIDRRTGTIEGRALVPNPEGLLTPGMFGEMRLYGRDPFEALLVPASAVQFDQDRQFLWTVGPDDEAKMAFVTLGRTTEDDMRIVEDGVAADTRIIVSSFGALRPGTKVAPRADAPQTASVGG